jgi:hypothetical protein
MTDPTGTMGVRVGQPPGRIGPPGPVGRYYVVVGRRHPATVVAAGGTKFQIWPEQLAQVQVGQRYEVEIAERVWQGRTLQSITKIMPYGNGDGAVAAAAAARTNGHNIGNSSRNERQAFVRDVLALIRAGQVGNDKSHLYHATVMLTQLYDHTFGA